MPTVDPLQEHGAFYRSYAAVLRTKPGRWIGINVAARVDPLLLRLTGGREKHPAWYHNLKANPGAQLEHGGRSGDYRAVEVEDDAERDRLFALADRIYPGYADYRERTAKIGRRIPIMRLKRV